MLDLRALTVILSIPRPHRRLERKVVLPTGFAPMFPPYQDGTLAAELWEEDGIAPRDRTVLCGFGVRYHH